MADEPNTPETDGPAGGQPGDEGVETGSSAETDAVPAGPRVRREKRDDWDDVPRLPYNRSLRLVWSDLIRIAMFVTMLVALIALRPHCGRGAAGFIESFAPPPDAGAVPVPEGYIRLTPEDVEKYFPRRGEPESEPEAGTESEAETEPEAGTEAEPEAESESEPAN